MSTIVEPTIEMPSFATPVDIERYGEYRIRTDLGDRRPLYRFEGRISNDGSTPFAAEADRYHIYSGWFCPWAQRVTIVRVLAGLDDVIGLSYVDDRRDARGWGFRESRGPDPVNGFALLREAYDATEPDFDGHVSVPTLWDRTTGTVASNQFKTIGIDFATRFRHLATPIIDTYPIELAAQIEELDSWIGPAINQGVKRVLRDDIAGERARAEMLAAFARLDALLAGQRYLVGDQLTEADVRLWVTLVRYDVGVNARRRVNPGLAVFPSLWAYAKDLYQVPAFRETTEFTSFTVPGADVPDWDG